MNENILVVDFNAETGIFKQEYRWSLWNVLKVTKFQYEYNFSESIKGSRKLTSELVKTLMFFIT